MDVCYINLDKRGDRRESMEGQFAALGIAARRVPATTPADLTDADRRAYCNPRRIRWLSETELCCALSHRKALSGFLSGSATVAAVFEDDVVLSPALPELLASIGERMPAGVGLLRLETDNLPVRLATAPSWRLGRFTLRRAIGWTSGTAGYLISRDAAAAVLAAPRFLRVPPDQSLFNPYERLARGVGMRHLVPAVCAQWDRLGAENAALASSDLERGRRSRRGPPHMLVDALREVHDLVEREIIAGSRRALDVLRDGGDKQVVPLAR